MLQSDTLNPAMLIHAFCQTDEREITMDNFLASREIAVNKLAGGSEALSINRMVFTKQQILDCYQFYSTPENWKHFENQLRNWNPGEPGEAPSYFRKIPKQFRFSWKKVVITIAVMAPLVIYQELKRQDKNSAEKIDVDEIIERLERSRTMNEASYKLDSLFSSEMK